MKKQKTEKGRRSHFLAEGQKMKKLELILRSREMTAFEYFPGDDTLILYDENLQADKVIPGYVAYLQTSQMILDDDREKLLNFFRGELGGPIEVKTKTLSGGWKSRILDGLFTTDKDEKILIGYSRDITEEKEREDILTEQARRDSLTRLYNHSWGKILIDEYLQNKDPYASCGLLVIDVDHFKNVNDTYGHLFGDRVLLALAEIFRELFDSQDIVMRAGGDEFVVLLKNIDNKTLVNMIMRFLHAVRNKEFSDTGYSMTCSVGVCFLPENITGYIYDQLFANADWALYQAKLNGRDRYEFCDNLQRFQLAAEHTEVNDAGIDPRYLSNDIISTAFEIFEKKNSFDAAMEQLLKVIGVRFRLDRITVILTNIKENRVGRNHQWTSPGAPAVLENAGSFTKEDFLTLFNSYDEHGTTVLQYDDMEMFSPEGAALLMQGEAKTVLYAAMYCEGTYMGAISYVVCTNKRNWSEQSRSQLGELTKLIGAHLAKSLAINASHRGIASASEYDSLTGLISFTRFREEVERMIVGQYARSHVMIYGDFENFRFFNRKYGYNMGDYILKEFSNYVIEQLKLGAQTYFTRVISDQFVLFMPCGNVEELATKIQLINTEFVKTQSYKFPGCQLKIRTGIYPIPEGCSGVSAAIDAANYARKQVKDNLGCRVQIYNNDMRRQQQLDNAIINGLDEAISQKQLHIYLQPKVSLKDGSVVGAEAQVRWYRKDGSVLMPGYFIPFYESNGRIIDLDLYIFERVVEFLAKNDRLGRKQVPISINASVLHAVNPNSGGKYLEILKRYNVDPRLTEMELLESAAAINYDDVRKLYEVFRQAGMKTSLDDFGAGYSLANIMADIPVDTVKLDRSIIELCESNDRGFYLLQRIVDTIKGLGYNILCEGVENEKQVEILKKLGCDQVQGFLFYKPMSIPDYEEMMYGQDADDVM